MCVSLIADSTAKLRRKGLLRGTQITDAAFAEALSKGKCGLSEEDAARYMEIVKKAAFSGEALTREEAVFCCKVYADFFKVTPSDTGKE